MPATIPASDRPTHAPATGDHHTTRCAPPDAVGSTVRYATIRRQTEQLCRPLETEDYVVQTMPDVSPTKWHLAHTAWFFETFLLKPRLAGYTPLDERYGYLFNSYYLTVGERHARTSRGQATRPTVRQVLEYRQYVDEHMARLLERVGDVPDAEFDYTLDVGLNHEQQHQELLLTDIKHVFACNPLYPVYRETTARHGRSAHTRVTPRWHAYAGGLVEVGHQGVGFAYDNEGPRHKNYLRPFALRDRLVTNGEYLRFIDDGGYRRGAWWLSDGWATVGRDGWDAPMYWEPSADSPTGWRSFTLPGMRPVDPDEPVTHLSYFEADAYARWADASGQTPGARLPTEFEWEHAVGFADAGVPIRGVFVGDEAFHPVAHDDAMFGNVWQWTRSPYSPYPGYTAPPGALGEYNGKFMCNQFVLRGGSCATPRDHVRATYRNFFPPHARWQFTGLRLAKDVGA